MNNFLPQHLFRKLNVIFLALLTGTILLGAILFLLPEGIHFVVEVALGVVVISLAITIGMMIDQRLGQRKKSEDSQNFRESNINDSNILQLNQELYSRAQEHTAELARLNIELQLQMAMVQEAVAIAQTNEERFRNMADNIQEGLTIIENDELVYMNERACEIFGDCPDGDFHNRIKKYAAQEEQVRLAETIRTSEQTGSFPHELEYWIIRRDGTRRCIRERYSRNSANGVSRIFVVTSDTTEAVQALQILETAVSDRTRELSTVLDVSHRIASTLELEPLLHLILDQIRSIIPYSGAAIFTLEKDELYVAAYDVPGLPFQTHRLYLPLNQAGPYQQVISARQVLVIDDIKGDTPLLRAFQSSSILSNTYTFEHARSWIGIPLVARDHVTGLLSLTNSVPNYYTQQHVRLAMTITNQVAVAIENARLYEQAQNLAVLEERHRIARELHDSVTQLLYGITLYCTATSHSIRSGNFSQVDQKLLEIKENALQALQEMRLLILELDPPLLHNEGLIAALKSSLEIIENRTGLQTELNSVEILLLSRNVEVELYRIAIEALNNLVRYARAKKVTVDLFNSNGWVFMEICDNGVGFDLELARKSGGMGISNMEQRAQQIGGWLEIVSSPGQGTRIKVVAKEEIKIGQQA